MELKKESEREAKQNSVEVLEQQMSQLFKMRVDVNDLDPEDIIVKCNKIEDGPITFFVHPIEGIASPLNRVMSKCTFPVYCFQFTRQVPNDSIESVASTYIRVTVEIRGTITSSNCSGNEEDSTARTLSNHWIFLWCLYRV